MIGGVVGLLTGAAELAPGLRGAKLLETRIGFRPVASDGRPLLGPLADGLIVAAGHGPRRTDRRSVERPGRGAARPGRAAGHRPRVVRPIPPHLTAQTVRLGQNSASMGATFTRSLTASASRRSSVISPSASS
jgi:hypothetical protein